VPPTVRVGELHAAHRPRLAEILHATAVFTDAEVGVALELFDEVYGSSASVGTAGSAAGTTDGSAAPGAPTSGIADGVPGGAPGGAGRSALPHHPMILGAVAPSPDYHFLGAFDADGELVGYACYGPTPSTDRTYDLYWIAVDPSAQGSGTGTRLLAEVERRVAALHARLLIVETSSRPEYAATRAFYQARRYDEAARVGSFYAPGDDRVIYTKRVQAAPEGRGAAAP
jgi:GNAT superfamily N-acetyltransferase